MKKPALFFVCVIFFACVLALNILPKSASAQQKYRVETEEEWSSRGWLDIVSFAGFVGTNNGLKLDLGLARYKYFNIGVATGVANSSENLGEWVGIAYLLPFGGYFPLKTGKEYAFGLNSNVYLLPFAVLGKRSEKIFKDGYVEELHTECPRLAELALSFDAKVVSLSAGYRFQFGEWTSPFMSYTYSWLPKFDIFEIGRLDGVFFQASVGAMWPLNTKREKFAPMVKEQFPPILSVNATLKEPSGNMLLDAMEKGEIQITVENNGRGNAWNLHPEIDMESTEITEHLSFDTDQTIRKIEPGDTALITIPVLAGWDVPGGKVTLHIDISEGNGNDAPPIKFSFGTQELLKPKFVITDIGINDSEGLNSSGNGDNRIQNMETIEVTAIIQNKGQGRAKDVKAKVEVTDESILYWGHDLFSLGDLDIGEFGIVKFSFYINNRYSGSSILPISIEVNEYYKKFGLPSQNLNLELNEVALASKDIDIAGRKHQWKQIPEAPKLTVDIEVNIPQTDMQNPDAFAVVIGNKNYEKANVGNVDFAINDAALIRQYLIEALGYKEGNIYYLKNARLGDFYTYFGSKDNYKGKLFDSVKSGQSDILIYYSGHGAPGLNDKKGYFVPVECDPYKVELNGYPLETFYNNLSKIPARTVTVVLDACFSGVNIFKKGISPVIIEVSSPVLTIPNAVVVSSSEGAQYSTWYDDKNHGMFTYFFLKAIHNRNGDANADGRLTFAEIFDYLSDRTNGVPYYARLYYGVDQMPTIEGGDKNRVLVKY